MRSLKSGCILIAFGILAQLMPATAFSYDLKYCYDLALRQDPQLGAAYYQKVATRESVDQAYSRFLPALNVNLDFTKSWQDIVRTSNSVMPKGSSSFFSQTFTVPLTIPLVHFDAFAQLSQAKITRSRGEQQFSAARQDLMVRVTDAYFGILAAKDNLKYIEAEESAVQMHYDFASGRFNRGLVPRTDLEDALAKLVAIRADKVEAQRLVEVAVQALQEIIASPVAEVQELKEALVFLPPQPDDVGSWLKEGKENNAVLRQKRLEAEEAGKEVSRQRAAHYPSADIKSQWYRKDTGGTIYGGGSVMDNYDVGVEVSIPIFSGGLISSRVRESAANYQRLREEATRQERLVNRQIHDAFYGMKSSITRIGAMEKSVESQSLVLEAKQQGFTSGLYSSVEVLDAAKDLKLFQKNLSKAKYDYIMNGLKLKLASGSISDGDLDYINGWLR